MGDPARMAPARRFGAVLLAFAAGPAMAELASATTPQGEARIEGDPLEGGQRLMVGDRQAFASEGALYLRIEDRRGSLLLLGLGSGGTACPALWVWLDAADPRFRHTEEFGTCADLVTVTSDDETVTVTMPSYDAESPTTAFVWDGRGPVREVRQGQAPSGAPPEAGAPAWIGRYPYDLLRSSDWRGPLTALLGEEGYALAQASIVTASPMEAQGKWVAGTGFERNAGARGAIAIAVDDGRLLVAVQEGLEAAPRLWGDPRGPLPAAIADVMVGQE